MIVNVINDKQIINIHNTHLACFHLHFISKNKKNFIHSIININYHFIIIFLLISDKIYKIYEYFEFKRKKDIILNSQKKFFENLTLIY